MHSIWIREDENVRFQIEAELKARRQGDENFSY